MDDEKLKSAANTLNEVLAQSGELDEDTREQLGRVAEDLQAALNEPAPQAQHAQSIRAQLREMLATMEAKHPHLTALITQLDDILAGIGI